MASESLDPTHGLAPGCSSATHWLALLTLCWKVQVELVSLEAQARMYVDDVLAHSRGPFAAADVAGQWLVTEGFRRATTWHLNAGKSNRFATSAQLRWELRQAAGPEVKEAFLDLGVVQVASARSAPALEDKRTDEGIRRFKRISRLPLPLCRRAQVTAASGVRQSTYGAGQQHVSDERLARERAANLAAVWRTAFRTVPELVFAALTVPWRADVLAVAVIQPWWFLGGAAL